jgi:hypothetical protein
MAINRRSVIGLWAKEGLARSKAYETLRWIK